MSHVTPLLGWFRPFAVQACSWNLLAHLHTHFPSWPQGLHQVVRTARCSEGSALDEGLQVRGDGSPSLHLSLRNLAGWREPRHGVLRLGSKLLYLLKL